MNPQILESVVNTEDGISVSIYQYGINDYRISIIDTESGNRLPAIRKFTDYQKAKQYAQCCCE